MSTQTTPDRILATEDAKLRWRLEGAGPAIVLLHGWALDLEYWDPAVARLARHFTILRFDRRGFGLSTGTPDVRRNVSDLENLLDLADIGRAVLVGMSQGARLAIHFALAHPARVRGLTLDAAPALDVESELPLAQLRELLAAEGPIALQAAVLRQPLMQLETGDPAAQRLLDSVVARYGGADLLAPAARIPAPDLSVITAPTLILSGELDSPGRQQAARRLQASIPTARRVELANVGHLALLDDPAAYASAIAEFCRSLPG